MLHGHFNIHCQHNVVELLLFYFFNSWFARPIWWKSIFSWGEDALPIGLSVEENVHKAHYHSINMMRQRRIRVSLMCLHEKVEPIKYSSGSLRAVVNLFIMNAISWKLTSIITQQLKNILLLLWNSGEKKNPIDSQNLHATSAGLICMFTAFQCHYIIVNSSLEIIFLLKTYCSSISIVIAFTAWTPRTLFIIIFRTLRTDEKYLPNRLRFPSERYMRICMYLYTTFPMNINFILWLQDTHQPTIHTFYAIQMFSIIK